MTSPVKNISISINCPQQQVYQFASNPENLPKWLAFVRSIVKETGTIWKADTSLGHIQMDFSPQNDFGVIDHKVTLPGGAVVSNLLRVIPNNDGSEVVFTLVKMPERTDEEFEEDTKLVETDLATLKQILEGDSGK